MYLHPTRHLERGLGSGVPLDPVFPSFREELAAMPPGAAACTPRTTRVLLGVSEDGEQAGSQDAMNLGPRKVTLAAESQHLSLHQLSQLGEQTLGSGGLTAHLRPAGGGP